MRTTPDVAYDANPSTGVSVYDSYDYGTSAPWVTVGGTSAGAPQWSALIAIADQGRALAGLGSLSGASQTLPAIYALPSSDFHDITSGSSTSTSQPQGPNYSAGPGYDLATGRGTPLANLVVADLVNYGTDLNWSGGGLAGLPSAADTETPFTITRSYNISLVPAGQNFTISYYATPDDAIGSPNAILIGTETISAAADKAVGLHTGTSPTLRIGRPGIQYVYAVLDSNNTVLETNETNNAVLAGQAVSVTGQVDFVMDNSDPGFTEAGSGWGHSNESDGYAGNLDYAAAGSGGNTATWQATGLPAGTYDVQVTWVAWTNHATNAPYAVYDGGTSLGTVFINQTQAPAGTAFNGFTFQSLGHFTISSGTLTVVLSDNANGYVIADALRLVQLTAAPNLAVKDGATAVVNGGSVNFGTALVGASAQTFTVTNTGTQNLTLGTPSVPAGFTLTQAPAATVAPGLSTTFAVQLNTASTGSSSGAVSFATNVTDANPFSFTVSGTVATSLVIDNGDGAPGFKETGSGWGHSNESDGYAGNLDYAAAGSGGNTATWQATGLPPGTYDVQVTWVAWTNHATNAPYAVYDGGTSLGTVFINQQQAPAGTAFNGFTFQSLGHFTISSGTLTVVLSDNANGYVIVDALRLVQLTAAPNLAVKDGATAVVNGGSVNFGTALVGAASAQTFTVTNTGTQNLTLGTPSVPAGFTLTQAPAATVAPGLSTTFAVQLNTASTGSSSGAVSFATNVTDANPFSFTVSGTVATSLVIDNGDGAPGFTETGSGWGHSNESDGYAGNLDYAAAGSGGNTATWQATGLPPGTYDVQVTWVAWTNHATNAPYAVYDGGTSLGTVFINQQQAPAGTAFNGFTFQSLGHFTISSGTLTVVLSDNANGYVIVDALRLVPV